MASYTAEATPLHLQLRPPHKPRHHRRLRDRVGPRDPARRIPGHQATAAALRSQRPRVLRPVREPEVEERGLDVYYALADGDGGAA